MFIKLCVILFVLQIGCAQKENRDWELAVVINDQIELLQSNGTLIGSTVQQFNKLKALTFDGVRHQFVVSDMDQDNDTIFTVQLTKETEINPIIPDLRDNVQGLAIDPLEDILYWTDASNKTINYVKLNDSVFESKLLFAFSDEIPQDIVIDVCRRYIYWSNSYVHKPTIERARLDGSDRQVIIDSDLKLPAGIAIDYKTQRLYWADMGEGIYYKIESSNLNGKEREIAYEGTHTRPFGIAVDEASVYWTDVNNNALWRFSKDEKGSEPEKIRQFKERPMGIVAKNVQVRTYPDCKELEKMIEEYGYENVTEVFEEATDVEEDEEAEVVGCLNGGEKIGNICKCKRGFMGRFCETENCHNYCVNGDCHLSSRGYPQCHCPRGFGGKRCQFDMCRDFCLNGGSCSYVRGDAVPKCECQSQFTGSRCEIKNDFTTLCSLYCRNSDSNMLLSQDHYLMCRCEQGSYVISHNNMTAETQASSLRESTSSSIFSKLGEDPFYLVQTVLLVISVIAVIFLSTYICVKRKMSKQRPRIKKRIIVNKNVTPLTYRPQPTTEQCEITIENCCNMNVCETPCFEPPMFKKNFEDKKNLLTHMENNEDLNY